MIFVWTIGDIVGATIVGLIALLALIIKLGEAWKMYRCKHDAGIGESRACDAICNRCGKNLGFIGTWKAPAEQEEKR